MRPTCPVCGHDRALIQATQADACDVQCARCGSFTITGVAMVTVPQLGELRHMLCGVLRHSSDAGTWITVTSDNIDELLARAPTTFSINKLIEEVLLLIAARTSAAKTLRGNVIMEGDDFPLFFLKSEEDLWYVMSMLRDLGLLTLQGVINAKLPVALTVAGWQRVDELQSLRGRPAQAFVAMWFDSALRDAYDHGIKPALEATGFDVVRVDLVHHSDRIDDRILAEIRRSGLLVGDFSGHRQGVYFETGFALGLGVPVIWTCRTTDIEAAHFDTRQYNHIVWANVGELKERLEARIRALGFAR